MHTRRSAAHAAWLTAWAHAEPAEDAAGGAVLALAGVNSPTLAPSCRRGVWRPPPHGPRLPAACPRPATSKRVVTASVSARPRTARTAPRDCLLDERQQAPATRGPVPHGLAHGRRTTQRRATQGRTCHWLAQGEARDGVTCAVHLERSQLVPGPQIAPPHLAWRRVRGEGLHHVEHRNHRQKLDLRCGSRRGVSDACGPVVADGKKSGTHSPSGACACSRSARRPCQPGPQP